MCDNIQDFNQKEPHTSGQLEKKKGLQFFVMYNVIWSTFLTLVCNETILFAFSNLIKNIYDFPFVSVCRAPAFSNSIPFWGSTCSQFKMKTIRSIRGRLNTQNGCDHSFQGSYCCSHEKSMPKFYRHAAFSHHHGLVSGLWQQFQDSTRLLSNIVYRFIGLHPKNILCELKAHSCKGWWWV